MVEVYAVQRCVDFREPSFGDTTTVEAQGPLAAAEKVLSTPLAMTGEPSSLAGRVLRLAEHFRPDIILVYHARVANENAASKSNPPS
jgi:hypothetical protein